MEEKKAKRGRPSAESTGEAIRDILERIREYENNRDIHFNRIHDSQHRMSKLEFDDSELSDAKELEECDAMPDLSENGAVLRYVDRLNAHQKTIESSREAIEQIDRALEKLLRDAIYTCPKMIEAVDKKVPKLKQKQAEIESEIAKLEVIRKSSIQLLHRASDSLGRLSYSNRMSVNQDIDDENSFVCDDYIADAVEEMRRNRQGSRGRA